MQNNLQNTNVIPATLPNNYVDLCSDNGLWKTSQAPDGFIQYMLHISAADESTCLLDKIITVLTERQFKPYIDFYDVQAGPHTFSMLLTNDGVTGSYVRITGEQVRIRDAFDRMLNDDSINDGVDVIATPERKNLLNNEQARPERATRQPRLTRHPLPPLS